MSAARDAALRVSTKMLRIFVEGDSLRSAPRLSDYVRQFDTRSAQSVFPRGPAFGRLSAKSAAMRRFTTYTPREKRFQFFRACGRELLRRAFLYSLSAARGAALILFTNCSN